MIGKYLWYVIRHKWYVFAECCKLSIPWLGVIHDLSKLLPSEFLPYARYFYGTYPEFKTMPAGLKYGYTGLTKESVAADFDVAWLLHQKRNRHHWQFWVLANDDGPIFPLPIPKRYLKELLADWRGAGKAVGKPDTKAWYLMQKEKGRQILHEDTRQWIEQKLSGRNSHAQPPLMGGEG